MKFTHDDFGQYVQAPADNGDIRPAIEASLKAIRTALQRAKGKKVVAIVGENHNVPAHKFFLRALLQRLKTEDLDFIAAFETPYDLLWKGLNQYFDAGFARDMNETLLLQDPYGRNAAQMYMAHYTCEDLPLSVNETLSFCLKENISMLFNDASQHSVKMDHSDPLTRKLIENLVPAERRDYVTALDPKGMAVRNHFTTSTGMNALHWHRAPLLIQSCGNAHVFGSNLEGFNHGDSLSALYAKAGACVLPLWIQTQYMPVSIPSDARPAVKSALLIEGVTDRAITPLDKEVALVNDLRKRSGLIVPLLNPHDVQFHKDTAKRILLSLAYSWIAKARFATVSQRGTAAALAV